MVLGRRDICNFTLMVFACAHNALSKKRSENWRNLKSFFSLTTSNIVLRWICITAWSSFTDNLKAGIIYFDGQQNDARMCITLAITAARMGANVTNYVEVTRLIKDEAGKVRGAAVRDTLTGKEWNIRAKSVINATGPFTDGIRLMDNPEAKKICQPSSGVHITLPGYFCPKKLGLLNAETSDGRVIFFLPVRTNFKSNTYWLYIFF